jgi:hypothetical protein
MAVIHRQVQDLLDAIADTPGIAAAATARILSAETYAGSPPREDRDPLAPDAEENADKRGLRQLRIADEVVAGILRRELALWERNRALLREINERTVRIGERSGLGIETVAATLPVGEDWSEWIDLLSEGRPYELGFLLAEWKQGVSLTERTLLGDGA